MANENEISDYFETDLSNVDISGITVQENVMKPSNVNNAFRALQGALARWYGDDTLIATATTNLGSVPGQYIVITGSTGITAGGTIKAGTIKHLKFTGAPLLTHNATSFILPGGANIQAAAGDSGVFVSEGSGNWRCIAYQRASGAALVVSSANIALAAAVGSSALTISLKGEDGNDPSSANVVNVPFRNVTLATGTPSYLAVTAATSLVISSGSTMGFTSATAGRVWIVGFNDGGTFRLGAVNCLSGTSVMTLRDGIYSSTAEGGAGGADTAQVIYTGTAVTSKALTVLGYFEWSAGLTTAGTWAIVPTTIQLRTPSVSLPGTQVQTAFTSTGALITSATPTPGDDTIPQSGEGVQALSQSITPSAAANLLRITSTAFAGCAGTDTVTAAIFRDSAADAVAASASTTFNAGGTLALPLEYAVLAGAVASTAFKLRVGAAATNVSVNGANGVRRYGGVGNTTLLVQEIMA